MLSFTPPLGVMELESGAYMWRDALRFTLTWLQDAGGFAAIGLVLWIVYVMLTPAPAIAGSRRKFISKFMAIIGALGLAAYLVAAGFTVAIYLEHQNLLEEQGATASHQGEDPNRPKPPRPETPLDRSRDLTLAIAGLLALIAFCEPFVADMFRYRGRRIYAIAKLSFKEAVRNRITWVFFLFLLIILFPATWFFFRQTKPEDALKTTISVISYTMTTLLIFTALLLSAFSIPADVKNQIIHTIVTKPVERFEIVIGRFLGYVALETIALTILTGVSAFYIGTSNVDEAAKQESMKARVPVYGFLNFARERGQNRQLSTFEGIDVGREYAYRKYIAGGDQSPHRAVWSFTSISDLRPLKDMSAVPVEFAFDVYRTTKGEENRGVQCTFDITTWKWDPAREQEYLKEIRDTFGSPKNITPDDAQKSPERAKADWEKMSTISKKYGRFHFKNLPVYDYHTYQLMIPPGLIESAIEGDPPKDFPYQSPLGPIRLMIRVKCESPSQFIGVAPLDLYFLESEGSFWVNFFKGAIGLWCRLTIVIGLAVAASTYLAGVVSFLAAAILFLGGYFLPFIRSLASGTNIGGGPFESFTRLVKGTSVAGELDRSPTVQIALLSDDLFRWLLRRIMNVIPDTERFTWSNYLAQGFSIDFGFILLNLLFLAGYMLPWAVLAYYLMRSREIAA